jgi:hypothetical protein
LTAREFYAKLIDQSRFPPSPAKAGFVSGQIFIASSRKHG